MTFFFFFFNYLKQNKNPNTSLPHHQTWSTPAAAALKVIGHGNRRFLISTMLDIQANPYQPPPLHQKNPTNLDLLFLKSKSLRTLFLVNFLKNILILGLLVLDVLDCLWIPYLFGFFWWSDGGWWDWLRCLAWCRLGDGKKF